MGVRHSGEYSKRIENLTASTRVEKAATRCQLNGILPFSLSREDPHKRTCLSMY
jgi:hypothetical protein